MFDNAPNNEQLLGRIVEKLHILTEEVKLLRNDVEDLKSVKDRTLGMIMTVASFFTGLGLLIDWIFHTHG